MKALGVGPPWQLGIYSIPRINNSGQVVGNRSSGGYLYTGSLLTTLPSGFMALDINNNNVIAMFNGIDSFISIPPYSTQTNIGRFQACGLGDTFITNLNDNGVATGINDAPNTCPQPFMFSNGTLTALAGFLPKARWMAINNANQIVGYWQDTSISPSPIRAVQLINGTLTDLDPSNATAYDSEAIAINNAGEFIVNSNEAICTRNLGPPTFKTITFVCRGTNWFPLKFSGSTVTTLPVLGPNGGTAAGINFWGDVVGASKTATGAQHAFINLYGTTIDINGHLTNGVGWTILQAYDINDNGQIVALGQDSTGKQDVLVLTPQIVKQPPPLGIGVNRSNVPGIASVRNASTGTVTLSSAAPAGGTIVFLSSSNPLVKVPPMVRVAPKSTTATFKITTTAPVGSTDVTFFATTGMTTKAATLRVTDDNY